MGRLGTLPGFQLGTRGILRSCILYRVAIAVVLPGGMALAVAVGASGEGIEDSFCGQEPRSILWISPCLQLEPSMGHTARVASMCLC